MQPMLLLQSLFYLMSFFEVSLSTLSWHYLTHHIVMELDALGNLNLKLLVHELQL